ncbi:MAG: DUF6326 family protein [Candidatus Bathyarchaeia archaeon]
MEDLAWRIRFSVLWLFADIAFVAHSLLTFLKPGVVEQVMAGNIEGLKITPEILFLYAIIFLFPLVMAFLSLTLKYSIVRWANIIMGIVGVVLSLIGLSEELSLSQPYAFAILIWITKIIVDVLIIWYAYKWPKEGT